MKKEEVLSPDSFKEKMVLVIGLGKGTFQELEPFPSKEELIQSLEEEREIVPEDERKDFERMIRYIENLEEEDFVTFYESVPFYELVNGFIMEKNQEGKLSN